MIIEYQVVYDYDSELPEIDSIHYSYEEALQAYNDRIFTMDELGYSDEKHLYSIVKSTADAKNVYTYEKVLGC
jgi:hypothetical protein